MPNRLPWFDRTFTFDCPLDLHPELIERLRGTPARIAWMVRSLEPTQFTRQIGDTWSIQENVGHLGDLESLFDGRLDDFDNAVDVLRGADLTNRATHEAGHNQRSFPEVFEYFLGRRTEIIERLEKLSPDGFARTALHPRLQQPMRVVDMLVFHAEHDDYHLARIRELIRAGEALAE